MIYFEQMRDTRLSAAFTAFVKESGYTNIFNPSIALANEILHITFRAESFPGEKPFRSIYTRVSLSDGGLEFSAAIDLSELLTDLELPRVADPKLVQLGSDIYATFNTGHIPGSQNDIYLMRLWPTQGPAQRCTLDGRQLVEKNWAFYLDAKGDLGAIYSLDPLVLLRLTGGDLAGSRSLQFSNASRQDESGAKGLNIGTQLSFSSPNTAFLIAHEKVTLLKWRGYFGRVIRFDFEDGDIRMQIGSKRMSHSLKKIIFVAKRHNPNLLWATYFSGLVATDHELLISYGINDLEFSFAKASLETVWT